MPIVAFFWKLGKWQIICWKYAWRCAFNAFKNFLSCLYFSFCPDICCLTSISTRTQICLYEDFNINLMLFERNVQISRCWKQITAAGFEGCLSEELIKHVFTGIETFFVYFYVCLHCRKLILRAVPSKQVFYVILTFYKEFSVIHHSINKRQNRILESTHLSLKC